MNETPLTPYGEALAKLAEAENSRDQYKALVDRYCQRHDARSCACEFGDDGDEPISQCNYHLDLSKRLAEAVRLLRDVRPAAAPMHTEYPKGDCCDAHRLLNRIDAMLSTDRETVTP